MKKVGIAVISILIVLGLCHIACAKPLKIENSFGQLVRCGEWKNTTNAIVIRGCPELGDFLDTKPEPTPEPTLEPTPTATPVHTNKPIICQYRFVETGDGLILEKVFPLDQVTHTCAYMSPVDVSFVELQSTNRSNTSCPWYSVLVRSPSGVEYLTEGTQPGTPLYAEVGTWQIDISSDPETSCGEPFGLQLMIRTKG